MDLKDFVSSTIMEIEGGINAAASTSESGSYELSGAIMFNLAITSRSADAKSGGASVKARLYVVEAKVGADKSSESSNEYVQRVQFEIAGIDRKSGLAY